MTRAESILHKMEEKGLLKAAAKGALVGAGGAILIHLGKKLVGKKSKKELAGTYYDNAQHTAAIRRRY